MRSPASGVQDAARTTVTISVCIPAYNRPQELRELLDSIASQDYPAHEVVICEDCSPQRQQIAAVVAEMQQRVGGRIRYFENPENLGYDGNYREFIRRSTGEFCLVMGNDDVLAPGALATVADVVRRTPDVGVILRSLAYFRDTPAQYHTISRYYPDELRFPPGLDTVTQFYRRAGFVSGLVFRREDALACATERYDGLVYYQMYVVASILRHRPGVIVPEVLAYYREGAQKAFGTNPREQHRFTPGDQNAIPEALGLVECILGIARGFDEQYGTDLFPRVRRDFARHSLATFVHHGDQSRREYAELYAGLWRMGLWRHPHFHASALAVAALGAPRVRRITAAVRRRLGYTPTPGDRPRGAVVLRSPALGNRPHAAPVPGTAPAAMPAELPRSQAPRAPRPVAHLGTSTDGA
jgi:glycosyltransferase involved in cell wall biosynthesis